MSHDAPTTAPEPAAPEAPPAPRPSARRRARPGRRRGWRRALALALVLAVLGTGCTAVRTFHFGVSFGNGVYVRVYQKPTWQVVAYNDLPRSGGNFCSGDEFCTLAFLRNNIDINWVGSNPIADIDYFFDPVQRNDFANALDQVRGTNPQKCLMLHRNYNPVGDRHNWTSASAGGECQLGRLVEL